MAFPKRVKVYRWRLPGSLHGNFGDEMTIPLLRRLFGVEAIPSPMEDAQFIGCGSILDAWALTAPRSLFRKFFPAEHARTLHVWGSGFILPDTDAKWPQSLRFHAVRGELTATRVAAASVLGDPGILASLLLEARPPKRFSVGLVPNYTDFEMLGKTIPSDSFLRLIDPSAPVEHVVSEIASCELIVSSSLHGLITADSFEIPCVWARTARPSANPPPYKFDDYATSRRTAFNDPLIYEEIFGMTAEELAKFATIAGRAIALWQDQMVAAFPEEM